MKRLNVLLALLLFAGFLKAQTTPEIRNIALFLQDGVEILDFAGPMEVFIQAGFNVYTVAETKEPIKAMGALTIIPDYTLEDAPEPPVYQGPDIALAPFHERTNGPFIGMALAPLPLRTSPPPLIPLGLSNDDYAHSDSSPDRHPSSRSKPPVAPPTARPTDFSLAHLRLRRLRTRTGRETRSGRRFCGRSPDLRPRYDSLTLNARPLSNLQLIVVSPIILSESFMPFADFFAWFRDQCSLITSAHASAQPLHCHSGREKGVRTEKSISTSCSS